MPRVSKICVLLILACMMSAGMAEDLTDIYQNSHTHKPFVRFAARSGAPGHSFVVLGEELDNGLKFTLGVYGFYPKDGKASAIKALFGTSGVIDFKWQDLDSTVQFQKSLTTGQKDAITAVMKKWSSNTYSILGNNCNKFASEAAAAAGLAVPESDPGSTLPFNYVQALKDANK